jgi:N-acetylglucosamine repressor
MKHLLVKATRQHTKDHNTRLVFRAIYEGAEISRAEVARRTGLTRTTVSSVVGELLERGLVEEVGTGQFSGGRLPILLRVAHDGNRVLAVSFEDTQIAGALISLRGGIQRRVSLPLAPGDPGRVVGLLSQAIDLLTTHAGRGVLGIGVSMPGLIDTSAGVVLRAVNFGLANLPLRRLLQERHGLPVHLGNAVHLTALGEHTFGPGTPGGSLIAVSVGVGIGAGIVLNGRLFTGDSFGAGEIGHVAVMEGGRPCNCGNTGCLETVASAPAIVRAARELAQRDPGALCGLGADPEQVDLATVRRAVERGDPGAAAIVASAGDYLALAVANAVSLLNIERIVLTGPVAALGGPLLDAVVAGLARRVLSSLAAATRVELLPESGDAVLRGAAAIVLDRELGLVQVAAGR